MLRAPFENTNPKEKCDLIQSKQAKCSNSVYSKGDFRKVLSYFFDNNTTSKKVPSGRISCSKRLKPPQIFRIFLRFFGSSSGVKTSQKIGQKRIVQFEIGAQIEDLFSRRKKIDQKKLLYSTDLGNVFLRSIL